MDIATGTWFKFLREDTEKHEPEEVVTEVVTHKSDKIEKWVKRQGGLEHINNEIDDMFGGPGRMRLAFPMGGEDARNLGEIVRVLRTHGWKPAVPMPGEGWNVFETYEVKQKEQRRVGALDDYPDFVPPPNPTTNPDPRPVEDVYRRKTVAKLDLRRTFPITIPAGPRKGETIEKTVKKSMSKAIAELAKRGDLSPHLLVWWDQKQIYYTNDEQWIGVQELFDGQEEEPYCLSLSKRCVAYERHRNGRRHKTQDKVMPSHGGFARGVRLGRGTRCWSCGISRKEQRFRCFLTWIHRLLP